MAADNDEQKPLSLKIYRGGSSSDRLCIHHGADITPYGAKPHGSDGQFGEGVVGAAPVALRQPRPP